MRKISIIVAMSQNSVIGINNQLPWHISEDLKNFKKTTLNHCVIMGRKTYDSIGKPLNNRRNIVISRDSSLKIDGVEVVNSLEKAISMVKEALEIFIIGGEQIYSMALSLATHLYITKVDGHFKGDAFFPDLDQKEWKEIAREDLISESQLKFSFLKFERIS
ncbi:dihydrofolate reductase [Methylophilaceae bacterium]|nr:dihydrofolate reductase [Methylophilaceae bacterium]|tara:strand:- start:25386 stop:25871 length:486 start_codon:yes stop_codon:yes gene_type:complete